MKNTFTSWLAKRKVYNFMHFSHLDIEIPEIFASTFCKNLYSWIYDAQTADFSLKDIPTSLIRGYLVLYGC